MNDPAGPERPAAAPLPEAATPPNAAADITPGVTGATESLQEEPSAYATLPPGSAPRQILAAYAAAGAKVLAWVVAAAVVYRMMGPGPFALFMLLRGTLALVNHTSFGLGPAVLHFSVRAKAQSPPAAAAAEHVPAPGTTLNYADTTLDRAPVVHIAPGSTPGSVLLHALVIALGLTILAVAGLAIYQAYFTKLHHLPAGISARDLLAVTGIGLGVLLRAIGDVAGGANQARGRLEMDQGLAALGDLLWATGCIIIALTYSRIHLGDIAVPFVVSGFIAMTARWLMALWASDGAAYAVRDPPQRLRERHRFSWRFAASLLAFGGLVTLGSLADFLYAPIAYVILNRLVDPLAVAVYAPAVQIDAALILLVTALAAVILPRAAIRHANQDPAGVWREYVRGSLAAATITFLAGLAAWLVSPWLFHVWLGDPLPATQAILPLVLLHTVLGSAGGVGRSTLIAVDRAGTYAASVLIGGLLNVALALGFVYAGWGIKGVILATIISVFIRCAIWMPWYVRRSLL